MSPNEDKSSFTSHTLIKIFLLSPIFFVLTLFSQESNEENENPSDETQEKTRLEEVQAVLDFTEDSSTVLETKEARRVPGGGGDILRSITSLPGVVLEGVGPGGLFDSTLFVRGSDERSVIYFFDGIRIGKPFHSFGIQSAFPDAIIKNYSFQSGGFSSKFANSQGAAIEIFGKEASDFDREDSIVDVDLKVDLTLFTGNVTAPVTTNGSFNFGGRRSYYELYLAIARAVSDVFADADVDPYYFDYNAVLDYRFTPGDSIRTVILGSGDGVKGEVVAAVLEDINDNEIKVKTSFEVLDYWNTQGVSYQYDRDYLSGRFGFYRYQGIEKTKRRNYEVFETSVSDYALNNFLSIPLTSFMAIEIANNYTFEYTVANPKKHPDGEPEPNADDYYDFDFGGENDNEAIARFFDDLEEYLSELVDNKGVLFRNYTSLGTDLIFDTSGVNFRIGGVLLYNDLSNFVDLDYRTRLSYKYIIPQEIGVLEFFGYAGKYTQLPSPTAKTDEDQEIPFLQNFALKSPYTFQYGGGIEWNWTSYVLKLEGYYKDSRNQTIINPTYDGAFDDGPQNRFSLDMARGEAYGIELFFRKRFTGWFSGWFSYEWSQAYVDRFVGQNPYDIFLDLDNNGQDYDNLDLVRAPSPQRVEHSLKLVGIFDLPKDVGISFRFLFGTGKPYTPKVVGVNPLLLNETDLRMAIASGAKNNSRNH